ncbi:hypothetical protein RhiJN_07550 [Ceratobasidium sp. AG-Ba]|nr:hypothetical protein RhiJN_07550 [Ceratobasidium sp. AG-Ba]QRW08397.1 hypothetical protein RhiLY_07396 [Ceratobasidium sp. AG-Ba]
MDNPTSFQLTSHYALSGVENGVNIVSHITHLVDSYFIWVGGTTEKLDSAPTGPAPTNSTLADDDLNRIGSNEDSSVDSLVARAMQTGLVAKDWACAMPSRQLGDSKNKYYCR